MFSQMTSARFRDYKPPNAGVPGPGAYGNVEKGGRVETGVELKKSFNDGINQQIALSKRKEFLSKLRSRTQDFGGPVFRISSSEGVPRHSSSRSAPNSPSRSRRRSSLTEGAAAEGEPERGASTTAVWPPAEEGGGERERGGDGEGPVLQPLTLSSLASKRRMDPSNTPLSISFGSDAYNIERKLALALTRNKELEKELSEKDKHIEVLRKQLEIRDRTLGLIAGRTASAKTARGEGKEEEREREERSEIVSFATLPTAVAAPSVWGSRETNTLARFVKRLKESAKQRSATFNPLETDDKEGLEVFTAELAIALAKERQAVEQRVRDLIQSESLLKKDNEQLRQTFEELKDELAEERRDRELLESSVVTLERWNDEKTLIIDELSQSLRDMTGEELLRTAMLSKTIQRPAEKQAQLLQGKKKKPFR